jgi:outer membrane protein assembly factor BamB
MKLHCALLLLLWMVTPSFSQSAGWPGWGGPDTTGVSKETGWNPLALKDGARVLWTADVGPGYSSVAISGGRVYTMGRDRKTLKLVVTCLEAATGSVVWSNDKLGALGEAESTPAVDGEFVYGLGGNGTLFCLKASSGKRVWQKDLYKDFQAVMTADWGSSPVVEGDLLILNAGAAGLALKKKNGERAWPPAGPVSAPRIAFYSSPVVTGPQNARVALFLGPKALNAVEVVTGRILWSFPHDEDAEVIADPIPVGTGVFLSTHYSSALIEPSGGQAKPSWKNESIRSGLAAPVLVNGYLFGQDWSEGVSWNNWAYLARVSWPYRCVDAKTGSVLWEKPMTYVSTRAAGGRLLLLELNGTLHVAEASKTGYRELAKADVLGGAKKARLFATAPVLLDGRIYCRNYDGDLVCIDVSR